jgi:hypothetical protein
VLGQHVVSSFTCAEGPGGPGLSACADQSNDPSGSDIDTSTLGRHTYTVTATSRDGEVGSASATYTVSAAASSWTRVPQDVTVSSKPLAHISGAGETHRSFRAASSPHLSQVSRRNPPVGTTFTYKLDRPAPVRFDFTRTGGGRVVNGKCVALTNRNQRNRSCATPAGSLRLAGHAGLNSVGFVCWLSDTKKLAPGNYTLVMTAITADVGSTSQRLAFTVLR